MFPQHALGVVLDGVGDDHKGFRWGQEVGADFIVTGAHRKRVVEVWHERLSRWEPLTIGELMQLVLWHGTFAARFQRAGRQEQRTLRLGWFRVRLPGEAESLSLVVVELLRAGEEDDDEEKERLVGLLTRRPVTTLRQARQVDADRRLRGHIEHGYRLAQEAGLHIEHLLVRSLETMQRLLVFLLWAVLFRALRRWPQPMVRRFQCWGGKLGRQNDRSGLYWLLWGLAKGWQALAIGPALGFQPALGPPQPTYG